MGRVVDSYTMDRWGMGQVVDSYSWYRPDMGVMVVFCTMDRLYMGGMEQASFAK